VPPASRARRLNRVLLGGVVWAIELMSPRMH